MTTLTLNKKNFGNNIAVIYDFISSKPDAEFVVELKVESKKRGKKSDYLKWTKVEENTYKQGLKDLQSGNVIGVQELKAKYL